MKTLHLTPAYKPAYVYGGPTLSVSRLVEALSQQDHVTEVLTTTANGKKELVVVTSQSQMLDGVLCTYYPRLTGDHTHFSPALLVAFLRKLNKTSIIHIHSWWNLVVIPALFFCRIRGIRPVLSPRGMLSPYTLQNPIKRLFHQVIGRWLLRGTVLHATSLQEAQQALSLIPNWPHFILPNIIELPTLGTFHHKSTTVDSCRFIILSRIHPVKGLEMFFAALAELDFKWKLQIVGEGDIAYMASLKQLVFDYGIANQIEWLGWLNGTEKFQSLANADLFVLPSLSENFANVVLESLATGTPVIISDQVGLHDYVSAKNLGWVVPLNKEAWVQALQTAWEARSLRTQIRAQAPALIHEDFGAEQLAKQYLAAYQQFSQKKS
ncbi:MAG: glycosyltransferase [Haliscomenobacter sp.]|uniref:XrtY-associated glycosyltransferase XYAG1 n=1 Tax=Haliscomenobacter sp. TaxID=2717303 RepID=UPI0029B0BB26|nr:glycosyltransferase [Haliscomenobacter sp.]MDX2067873.1 glycosyltransferase [Haliscomenobacter sp.]